MSWYIEFKEEDKGACEYIYCDSEDECLEQVALLEDFYGYIVTSFGKLEHE